MALQWRITGSGNHAADAGNTTFIVYQRDLGKTKPWKLMYNSGSGSIDTGFSGSVDACKQKAESMAASGKFKSMKSKAPDSRGEELQQGDLVRLANKGTKAMDYNFAQNIKTALGNWKRDGKGSVDFNVLSESANTFLVEIIDNNPNSAKEWIEDETGYKVEKRGGNKLSVMYPKGKSMKTKALDSRGEELQQGDIVQLANGMQGSILRVNRSGNYIIVGTTRGEEPVDSTTVRRIKSMKGWKYLPNSGSKAGFQAGYPAWWECDDCGAEHAYRRGMGTRQKPDKCSVCGGRTFILIDDHGVKVNEADLKDPKKKSLPNSGSKALSRLDQALVDKIINSNQRGSELLDYVNSRYSISEEDWEKFASGRYANLFDARDAASKKKIISLLEKMAKSLPNKGTKAMDDTQTDLGGQEPYGAQVARRCHEDMSILMKDYDEMINLLDHEGLKSHLTKTLENMEQNMSELEDMFSESYPHLKALGDDAEDGDLEPDEDFETKDDDALEDAGGDLPDDDLVDDKDADVTVDDTDATVPADSVDDEGGDDLPSPEEVVEGMEVGTKSLKTKNKTMKNKRKSLDKDDDKKDEKGCKFLLAYRQKGAKAWKKKGFDTDEDRDDFAKSLIKAMDEDVEMMAKDLEEDEKDKKALEDDDKKDEKDLDDKDDNAELKRLIKDASAFLDDIAEEGKSFGDDERLKSYYHAMSLAKALPGMDEDDEFAGKGWHKDMDEDGDKKDEKSLKRKALDEEEDADVKMCKDCCKFLKSLAHEKAFGDGHRVKAAYFKNALDNMDEFDNKLDGKDWGSVSYTCSNCGESCNEKEIEKEGRCPNCGSDGKLRENKKALDEDDTKGLDDDKEEKDLDEEDSEFKDFDPEEDGAVYEKDIEMDEDTLKAIKALRKSVEQNQKTMTEMANNLTGMF